MLILLQRMSSSAIPSCLALTSPQPITQPSATNPRNLTQPTSILTEHPHPTSTHLVPTRPPPGPRFHVPRLGAGLGGPAEAAGDRATTADLRGRVAEPQAAAKSDATSAGRGTGEALRRGTVPTQGEPVGATRATSQMVVNGW